MNRRLTLLLLAALAAVTGGAALLTATNERTATARATSTPPAGHGPLVAGDWWRGDLGMDQEVTLPGGAPALQLGLRAVARVTEAEDAGGEQRRVWQLDKVALQGAQGTALAVDAAATDLGRTFGAAYDDRGHLVALYVPAGGDALASGLREQLVSLTQLDLGLAADGWTAEELDPVGVAEVRYRRDGSRLTRTRERYLRLVAGDAREVRGAAETEARLGPDRRIDTLRTTDSLQRSLGSPDLQAAVALSLSAQRVDAGSGPAPTWDATWVRVTPGLGAQVDAAKVDLEQQILAGATLDDLLGRLSATTGIDRARLARQLSAYLRLHPEAVTTLRGAVPGASVRDADVLLQALAQSGVAGAPAAVADVLAADLRPEVRGAAARELSLAASPDPVAIAGLERGLADPDPAVREASQLGVGALVRAGADPALVTRLAEGFDPEAPDAATRLAALGNSGVPETVDVAMQALTSGDPSLRASALSALRHVDAPVDEALWVGFADINADVRLAAVRAADAAGGAATDGLVDLATADQAAAVRAAALRALADHREDADVIAAAQAAAQDPDPGVRAAAAALTAR